MSLDILLVTKPFGPPWRDSSKNLARDLATHGVRYRYRVLAPKGSPLPDGPLVAERIYNSPGDYAPSLAQNLRVLARLSIPSRGEKAWHFFHAPNVRTALAARGLLSFPGRRMPALHTVCSLPPADVNLAEACFADRTIVLSQHAEALCSRAGVRNVTRLDPCVPLPPAPSAQDRAGARQALALKDGPVVLFAGDLEMGRGAPTFVAAMPRVARRLPEVQFLLACRAKTAVSQMAEEELRALVRGSGLMERTRFLGETDRMEELLLAADVQALPARSLEKKMDFPLVLLEGFGRMLPAVVGDAPSLLELAAQSGGACVSAPSDDPDAVADRLVELLNDPAALRQRGVQARTLAETRFHPDRFAQGCEALYDGLLKRR